MSLSNQTPSSSPLLNKEKVAFVRKTVARLTNTNVARTVLPAENPISLERDQLETIKTQPYVVHEKSDGTRYYLLLYKYPKELGGTFFSVMIDRKWNVYEVKVVALEEFFQGSLFDGELVLEFGRGIVYQTYLVFNILCNRGKSMLHNRYLFRLKTIKEIFSNDRTLRNIDPEQWDATAKEISKTGKIVSRGNDKALEFRSKKYFNSSMFATLWDSRHELKHCSDGFIFTPLNESIKFGTNPKMLKWKEHHTVDFLFEVEYSQLRDSFSWTLFYADPSIPAINISDLGKVPKFDDGEKEEEKQVFNDADVPTLSKNPRHMQHSDSPIDFANTLVHFRLRDGMEEVESTLREYRKFEKTVFVAECECDFEDPVHPNILKFLQEEKRKKQEDQLPPIVGKDKEETDQAHQQVFVDIKHVRIDRSTANQKHTITRTFVNILENLTADELLRSLSGRGQDVEEEEDDEEQEGEDVAKTNKYSEEHKNLKRKRVSFS